MHRRVPRRVVRPLTRGDRAGIDHLGIQAVTEPEAATAGLVADGVACCAPRAPAGLPVRIPVSFATGGPSCC